MCWYIIFGCIALVVVIFVLVGTIQEIHSNNKAYKKDMDRYNSDRKYVMWNEKPHKKKVENKTGIVCLVGISIVPLLIIALAQVLTYYGNIELAETYKYLSQYETYDFGRDYDSLAIKNNILIKFNDYNESLAKAKTNVSKFPFWTFDNKEIINNLDYLMFK